MNGRTTSADRWQGVLWIVVSAAGFGAMAIGTVVNLEVDTVARYVARLHETEAWT